MQTVGNYLQVGLTVSLLILNQFNIVSIDSRTATGYYRIPYLPSCKSCGYPRDVCWILGEYPYTRQKFLYTWDIYTVSWNIFWIFLKYQNVQCKIAKKLQYLTLNLLISQ